MGVCWSLGWENRLWGRDSDVLIWRMYCEKGVFIWVCALWLRFNEVMAIFYVLPLCLNHHLPSLPACVALYKQMLKFPLHMPRLVSARKGQSTFFSLLSW